MSTSSSANLQEFRAAIGRIVSRTGFPEPSHKWKTYGTQSKGVRGKTKGNQHADVIIAMRRGGMRLREIGEFFNLSHEAVRLILLRNPNRLTQ